MRNLLLSGYGFKLGCVIFSTCILEEIAWYISTVRCCKLQLLSKRVLQHCYPGLIEESSYVECNASFRRKIFVYFLSNNLFCNFYGGRFEIGSPCGVVYTTAFYVGVQ
jgi:hypothetical protein